MKQKLAETWILITSDRKKAGVLGLLVLALVLAGAKALLPLGPNRTVASTEKPTHSESVASAGREAVSRALASATVGGGSGIVEVAQPPRLSRNLFVLDESHFPRPLKAEGTGRVEDRGGVERVESVPVSADDEWALLEARVGREATKLRLKSVVVGREPVAVLEETGNRRRRTVLRPGESVDGFVLVEVSSDSVLLEKERVRIRLPLMRPTP